MSGHAQGSEKGDRVNIDFHINGTGWPEIGERVPHDSVKFHEGSASEDKLITVVAGDDRDRAFGWTKKRSAPGYAGFH